MAADSVQIHLEALADLLDGVDGGRVAAESFGVVTPDTLAHAAGQITRIGLRETLESDQPDVPRKQRAIFSGEAGE
ncbi:MAG: hypothetical protein ACFCUT_19005 [Kiloniellaceae bacterium]